MARLPSTPEEFQQHFSENKVVLIASSPPGQSIQKYFFYAQQVHRNFIIVTCKQYFKYYTSSASQSKNTKSPIEGYGLISRAVFFSLESQTY